MLTTFLDIVHVFVCAVLMFVVLLQQGKGGGMGAAFGGGGAAQVFGGRGAGNLLTRATAVCAGVFMLTSVSLAYLSSSGDRALKARAAMESQRKAEKGTARPKQAPVTPPPATAANPTAPATTDTPASTAPATDTPAAPATSPAPAAPAPSK
jgi:preprotein translocase subunit SecG